MTDLALILGAVALAGVGGELFLNGVLGAAASLRVPKLLVATTLAAFATSSPELTVSSVAALAGKPEIGLGDALGSNVVNIALIFLIPVDDSEIALRSISWVVQNLPIWREPPAIYLLNVQAPLPRDISRFIDAGTIHDFQSNVPVLLIR